MRTGIPTGERYESTGFVHHEEGDDSTQREKEMHELGALLQEVHSVYEIVHIIDSFVQKVTVERGDDAHSEYGKHFLTDSIKNIIESKNVELKVEQDGLEETSANMQANIAVMEKMVELDVSRHPLTRKVGEFNLSWV